MSHFPDLGTETQIAIGPYVRAIGWLSGTEAFPVGDAPDEFVGRLRDFCANWPAAVQALDWPIACGFHLCELCNEFYASGNIGVPANKLLFVAPEMVAHYVEQHRYLPPRQFIDAILASPMPGTTGFAETVIPFKS
jgi:hypothetical protein